MIQARSALRCLLLFLAAGTLLVASYAPAPAAGAQYVMKIALATVNDIQHEWAKRMEKRLEKRTKGRIDVQIYPSSQLGNNQRMLEGVQLGTIEATIQPPEFMSGFEPAFQIPELPFLFGNDGDMDLAYKVITSPLMQQRFLGVAKGKGIQGVGFYIYGPLGIQAHQIIRTPADLKGKKIRILAAQTEIDTMAAWGATGVPMALADVFTGLQQRTVDGVQTAAMVAVPLKFYDLVKYYNDTRHAVVTTLAVVSIKWMNTLPPDLQKAVVEEARDLHKEMLDFSKAKSDQFVKFWKRQPKNEFIELTAAERKEFKDQAISVYGKFYKNHPGLKPLVEQIQAEVKKFQGAAR